MAEIFDRVERVAETDVNVLIQGETGTGKEMIARELHLRSERAEGPFIAINCGAIPHGLIESELFGHVKGAFTDAIQAKEGSIRAANGGTLFLDELGELPLPLQVRFLRVIQERVVQPLGSNEPLPIDVRLVCATQVNLSEAVKRGAFREDLFYRINTVTLSLPPLRERGSDVLLITQYLIQRFCDRYDLEVKTLSTEATEAVQRYSWPGNIRELENRISQALILSNGEQISALDLQLNAERLSMELKPLAQAKDEFVQEYVERALSIHQGNRTRAAIQLGVDPRTIFRLLKKKSSSDEGA
jgi:DNA-binding NtrC family response regulator